MSKTADLKERWMKDPAFRAEYDALAEEFALPEAMIAARKGRKMTQEQVAERMRTTQSAVARLEAGDVDAKVSTLRAYAQATGTELVIEFRPKAPPATA